MAASAKMVVSAALGVLLCGEAYAQQTQASAAPPTHCEGTLCDLYYGSQPATAVNSPTTPSTSSTPQSSSSGGLMNFFGRGNGPANAQPAEPPSASNSYMSMGGGGVLGRRQERCSGTLCDAYYGSSPEGGDEKTAGAQTQTAASAGPPLVRRHIPHESETRPKCTSPSADPWRCFR